MTAFIKTYADDPASLQQTFDAAVVMPTILRPEIGPALRSIFAQNFAGRIQVLVGIDKPLGDVAMIDEICRDRPPHCVVQLIYFGYSTAQRHGGLSRAGDGGVLRCVLSFLANSPYVAYLDDDNWWHPDHLRLLRQALGQGDWAFSLRWFVHPVTGRNICIDRWESVGPGAGLYTEMFGGFVDPNSLMVDKTRCSTVLQRWTAPLSVDDSGMSADRNIFDGLSRGFTAVSTGEPTSFYRLDPTDEMHPTRMELFGALYARAGEPSP